MTDLNTFYGKKSDGGGAPAWLSWLSLPLSVSAQVKISGSEFQPHLGLCAEHGVGLRFSLPPLHWPLPLLK